MSTPDTTLSEKKDELTQWQKIAVAFGCLTFVVGAYYYYYGNLKPKIETKRKTDHETMLAAASTAQFTRVIAIINKYKTKIDTSVIDDKKNSIFHYAAAHGQLEALMENQYINKLDANIYNIINDDWENPFLLSVKLGVEESINYYLTQYESEFLFRILQGHQKRFLRIMAEHLISKKLTDTIFGKLPLEDFSSHFKCDHQQHNETPFHVALRNNNSAFLDAILTDDDFIQSLQNKSDDIFHTKDHLNKTPLHVALETDLISPEYFKHLSVSLFSYHYSLAQAENVYEEVCKITGGEKSLIMQEKHTIISKCFSADNFSHQKVKNAASAGKPVSYGSRGAPAPTLYRSIGVGGRLTKTQDKSAASAARVGPKTTII